LLSYKNSKEEQKKLKFKLGPFNFNLVTGLGMLNWSGERMCKVEAINSQFRTIEWSRIP
jgi:hypothetical protein